MLFTTILKDNKSFLKCYRKGKFTASNIVVAYYCPNGTPFNRMGITVGKKQGNAVERNRIKRIIRAAYRLNEEKLPLGYDIVFVGKNNISSMKTQDIENFIVKRLVNDMNRYVKKVPNTKRKGGKRQVKKA